MNSSLPASSNSLCPIDGRRSMAEFVSKLIVVHLTTITAFCHLLRIRNEKLLSSAPFFYVFTPYSIIFRHTLAVLAIFLNFVVYHCFPSGRFVSVPNLRQSFSWLLGKAIKKRGPGYTELPTLNPAERRSASSGGSSQGIESLAERGSIRLGRIVLAMAFLAQCIGSIFLYYRRQQHSADAITIADQRVFELACGGLLIAVLTLGTVAKFPLFNAPIPENATRVDGFVILCRDPLVLTISGKDDSPLNHPFWTNGVLSFIIICASSRFNVWHLLRGIFHDMWTNENYSFGLEGVIFIGFIYISALVFIVAVCPCLCASRSSRRKRGGNLRGKDYPPCWYCLFCPCGVAVLIFPMMVVLGAFSAIAVVYAEYSYLIWNQVEALQALPEDVACPMLWKDPLADWVFWLA